MGKKNKNKLVEKVAAETKVDAKDLERLPTEALEKLDAAVPDEDGDIFEGTDAQEEAEQAEFEATTDDETEVDAEEVGNIEESSISSSEVDPSDVVVETEKPVEGKLTGYHPITKEPVYL